MRVGRGLCAPIGIFDRGNGSRFWTGDGGVGLGIVREAGWKLLI